MKGVVVRTRVFTRRTVRTRRTRAKIRKRSTGSRKSSRRKSTASRLPAVKISRTSRTVRCGQDSGRRTPWLSSRKDALCPKVCSRASISQRFPPPPFSPATTRTRRDKAMSLVQVAKDRLDHLTREMEKEIDKVTKGDELKPASSRPSRSISLKSAASPSVIRWRGRHGNKGCMAKIVPVEDIPVHRRRSPAADSSESAGRAFPANVGQVLEVHLGWAAKVLGFKVATPVFDGASFERHRERTRKRPIRRPRSSITRWIRNTTTSSARPRFTTAAPARRSPEPRHDRLYVLPCWVTWSKIRSTHAPSAPTPPRDAAASLGGKSRSGGQRFGEMEVCLEAYGAAYTLQELPHREVR